MLYYCKKLKKVAQGLVKDRNLPPKLDSTGNIVFPAQLIKMVDYVKMVPLLIEGYNEQQTIIESLNTRITDLEVTVAGCCGANRTANPVNQPKFSGEKDMIELKLTNVKIQYYIRT